MFQICRVAVCAGTPRFPLRAIGDRGAGIVTDRRTATWPVAERAPVTAFILSPAVESVCPEWHCWHLGPDTGHSSHPIPSHPIPRGDNPCGKSRWVGYFPFCRIPHLNPRYQLNNTPNPPWCLPGPGRYPSRVSQAGRRPKVCAGELQSPEVTGDQIGGRVLLLTASGGALSQCQEQMAKS